jgi:hypothetical protein
MFERMRRNLAVSGYGALGLEIIVVILSILIAFQIDRWAQDRRDRDQEYEYLLRLTEDLQLEINSINEAIEYAESRIAAVMLLEEAIANPLIVMDDSGAIPVALETATWRSFPQISAFVYTELQSSGNLALIRSESLRRDLANHYSSIRHYSRVGLDLDIQRQFDRLTAGILSTAELRRIEEGAWSNTTVNISAERAREIIAKLARRQDAVNLLPNIAQHHVFNLKVMELARSRTRNIVDQVESLMADFKN